MDDKTKNKKILNAGYVSTYKFDINKALKELKIISFDKADEKWLNFVLNNRKGQCKEIYDIVIGPVADDGVYEVVIFYEIGVYDLDEALKRLKVEKLYNQILFHTKRSFEYLEFIESEENQMNKEKFTALMIMITPDIISKIMEKYNFDENKAMALFHKSEVYKAHEKEETKVWQYSSEMIVELFDQEINGKLEFPEV